MSHAINVDFIGPKNSKYVTIVDAEVIPQVTNFSYETAAASPRVTITGSACIRGNIVTVKVDTKTFTANGTDLYLPLRQLGIPVPSVGSDTWPYIVTADGVTQTGSIMRLEGGATMFYTGPGSGRFPAGRVCTIPATTIEYIV